MTKNSDIRKLVAVFLSEELKKRTELNPKYSMRAFAQYLSVDSSYLSKILSGKRAISISNINHLAEKLDFPDEIVTHLASHYPATLFKGIDSVKFQVISDWYHYAILETTRLDHFKPEPKWISEYLGVPVQEIAKAIERLITCGLLEITKTGKWIVGNNTTTTNRYTHMAFRNMQMQIMEQGIEALKKNVPLEERDQSSITMCVDKKRLVQAKKKIKKFRRDLMVYLENGQTKDDVYHLCISLFPVAAKSKKNHENYI